MLKVKSYYDTEATVIGYQSGAGANRGKCTIHCITLPLLTVAVVGALVCKMKNGKEFLIGSGY